VREDRSPRSRKKRGTFRRMHQAATHDHHVEEQQQTGGVHLRSGTFRRGGSRVATLTIPTMAETRETSSSKLRSGTVTTDRRRQRFRSRAERAHLFRTSGRSLHSLLHRDVGAVLVLRDPPAPRAVHDRRHGAGRIRVRQNDCLIDRWDLRRVRVPRIPARRLDRRQTPWVEARDLVRRNSHRAGTPVDRAVRSSSRIPRFSSTGLIVMGTGLLKPNIYRDRRRALSRRRISTRCRLLDLLHGPSTSRRSCPAHHRLSGRTRRLAPWLWRSGSRNGDRLIT